MPRRSVNSALTSARPAPLSAPNMSMLIAKPAQKPARPVQKPVEQWPSSVSVSNTGLNEGTALAKPDLSEP